MAAPQAIKLDPTAQTLTPEQQAALDYYRSLAGKPDVMSIARDLGLPEYAPPEGLADPFASNFLRDAYVSGIFLEGKTPEEAAALANEHARSIFGEERVGTLLNRFVETGDIQGVKAAVQAGIIDPVRGESLIKNMASAAGTPVEEGMVPGYEVLPDGTIGYTGQGATPYTVVGDRHVQIGTVDALNPITGQFKTQLVDNRTTGTSKALAESLAMLASGFGAAGLGPAAHLTELGLPSTVASLVSGVGTGMLSGADLEQALRGAIIGQGVSAGADLLAPYANDLLGSLKDSVGEVGLSAYDLDEVLAPAPELDFKRRGVQVADASGDLTGLVDGPVFDAFSPNSYMNQPGFTGAGSLDEALQNSVSPVYGDLAEGVTYAPGMFSGYDPVSGQAVFDGGATMPPATPEEDPTFGGELEETAPGTFEQSAPPPPEQIVTAADLKRYASIAQKVYGLLGGEEKATAGAPRPPTRPQRPAGELTPEQEAEYQTQEEQYQAEEQQFLTDTAEYLGLDLVSMSEAGLIPGTPEYLTYILDQADSVIRQVLGDADPEAEDFADRLREKSEQEMIGLMRALYVRGQLGALSGSGTYEDPFTGKKEDVALPDGIRVRPNVAAYQRGLARSVDELAKMSPQEGKRFIGGMLDRRPDLFRMQARRDATGLREALTPLETEEMKRKRRGMFGDSAYFQQELGGMGQRDLDALLTRLVGRDEGRRGAAIEELFQWQPEEI